MRGSSSRPSSQVDSRPKSRKTEVEKLNIIPNEQFGFGAIHSSPHQVQRLTEHILSAFAFDRIWHYGLVYKLYQFRVSDRLLLIIRNFLLNRSFRYRVEGVMSTPRPVSAGVLQGSVLFSIYSSDIPKPRSNVEVSMFADDTAIYTSSRYPYEISQRLQSAADSLGNWFLKWRIEVIPEKSTAVLFER